MARSKDPEVADEMRAAGRLPEDDAELAEQGAEDGPGKPAAKARARSKAKTKVKAGAAEDVADEMSDDALTQGDTVSGESEAPDDGADDAVSQDDIQASAGDEIHVAHPADSHAEFHPEEHGHRSLAATALGILVGAIAIASATLWAAPRVAPHVPAVIGQYLMPGQLDTVSEIDALRQQLADQTAQTAERIAALRTRLDAATSRLAALPDPAPAAANAAEALELARAASAQAAALTNRTDTAATELAALRESMAAMNASLTGKGGEAAPAGLAAAVAGLNSRVDSLAGTVANRADLAALTARIDAIETKSAAASEVQNQALGEVSTAIRQASLRSAVAALTSRLEGGQPYAAALGEIAALTGSTPPPALESAAATGLATPAALGAGFGPRAQAAITADIQARAGGSASSQVLGWLRAQVTGRPVTEQAGDDVAATTSRIAARLREGTLPEALAEAGTLPPHAQAALGSWLDRLRARVEAGAALSAWLTEIGANG